MVKTRSAIFIDASVEAPSVLLAGMAFAADALILSPAQDGIEQITLALQSHPGVSDVHIVAHGVPGGLRLGNTQLTLQTLHQYRHQLQQWFAADTVATVSLYGCNVAAGDAGAEFLTHLQSLTGASIAASPRLVGHASRGGDWHLDTVMGFVPSRSLLTEAAIAGYPGILADDTFANATALTDNDTGSNVGATHETGEPIHDPTVSNLSLANQADLNDSIWWQWTAPETGEVTVNTAGSALNTVLAVYTGSTVNNLTLVGRNDDVSPGDSSSSVTFAASANTTYFFAVDGVGSAQGNIAIAVDTAPEITPGQIFSVSENAAVNDNVGTVQVNETGLTFAIAAGNPDNDGDGTSAFAISNTGDITVQDADDLDFETFDSFYTLQVTADDGGFVDTESVFVEVTDGQDDPVLVSLTPSQTTTDEGNLITLSGQILDPDQGENQTVTIDWGDGTTTVVNGDDLTILDAAGNKTFARNHIYQDDGQFTITVTVDDGGGNPASDTRAITVNNVAPTITQGNTTDLQVNEDSASIFQLAATDPSLADTLAWSIVGQATNGTASVSASPNGQNQLITYTPNANFSGTDSFQVQVADDDGGTDTIIVNVDVAAQPDTPANLTLSTSNATLNEGDTITLTGSFSDPDEGDAFTVTIDWGDGSPATVLTNNDLTANGNGTFSFTADHAYVADTNGNPTGITVSVQDSFGAIASASTPVTVNNVAPTITPGPNTSIAINEDGVGTITFTATDPADTSFIWSIDTDGTNGTATVDANPTSATQTITYTPAPNFSGIDEFVVAVDDGDGGTNTVTVVVGVDPVNDDPVNLQITPSTTGPLDEGTTFTLDGSFEDIDLNDTHTVTITWGDGTTTVLQEPDLIDDGAGNLSFTGIEHIYADEGTGTYTIEVTATDAAGVSISTTQDITVNNVAPVITDPDGSDDGATTLASVAEDGSADFTLTATDVGTTDSLTWSILTQGNNGTVTLGTPSTDGTQTFTYAPNANFAGPDDTFTLQVSDGDGGLDAITVTIPIAGSNDPPEIIANQFDIVEGQELLIDTNILDAFDLETSNDSQITFTITGLAAGDSFFVAGTPQNTFTRADILANTVTFLGNGDEIAPSFTITVQDAAGGSVSAAANIASFTPANDAPVFAATDVPFTVTEGGTIAVRATNISATDEESDDQSLTFTVSNVVAGEFLVDGSPSTTFTLAQINQNAVRFRHDGSETPPTYTVTVSDGELTATREDIPTFTSANDLPEIVTNQFDLTEGETLPITTSVLDAFDLETTDDSQITFTITGLATGDDFLVSGTPQTTFTRADILAGNVTFVGSGQSFTITVTDGDGGTTSEAANIASVTPVNDAPVFDAANVVFAVSEGGTVAIRATNISATDEETDDQALTFTISNLVAGEFLVNGSPSNTFTLQEINQNLVRFRHDGSETAPSYTVTVSDGELTATREDIPTFNAANDAPEVVTNQFDITEGEALLVDTSVLDAVDVETTDDSLITFTINGLATGDAFLVSGTPQNTFTRADIAAGNVTFLGNGDEVQPNFTITVADDNGGSTTVAANIASFTPVNDEPIFTASNVPFTVSEGGTVAVRANNISATDEETDNQTLTFTVSNLVAGEFLVNGSPSNAFTLQQINQNLVRFRHDGSETAPTYTVTVSDGEATATREDVPTFNAANDAPEIVTNQFDITEGQPLLIDTGVLDAIDVETTDDSLINFTINGLATGEAFQVGGTPQTTFTLADILAGTVTFLGNGDDVPPNFTITVADDNGGSTTVAANIASFTPVNDAPVFDASDTVFTVSEGGTVAVRATHISATDEETDDQALTFTINNLVAGEFLVNGTPSNSFTLQQINQNLVRFRHDGSETPPSYTVTVSDGELTTTRDDVPNFNAANDAPEIITNQFDITEGEALLVDTTVLDAVDVETTDDSLITFTINGLATGEAFQVGGTPQTTFTLADVLAGTVTFLDDGDDVPPNFTITVTDDNGGSATVAANIASFTAVNSAPVFDPTDTVFTIAEGGTVAVRASNISATDEETDDQALTFTISNLVAGEFLVNGTPSNTFTLQQINQNLVRFRHDGSETAPTYTVAVSDGELTTTRDDVPTFNAANDAPDIITNQFNITEGEALLVDTTVLDAVDVETTDDSLITFTVNGLATGDAFLVSGTPQTTFTRADIVAGNVTFLGNGDDVQPNFTLTVADDNGGSTTVAANIASFTPVNDAPVFDATDTVFTVAEGGTVAVRATNISATDEETDDQALTFTISNLVAGEFLVNGSPSNTFTLQQINQNLVRFRHDGSETPPTYTVAVSDGELTTTRDDVPNFNAANDAPEIVTNQFDITEGQPLVIDTGVLDAIDVETTDDSLIDFTINGLAAGDAFLVSGTPQTTFTLADILAGNVTFLGDGDDVPPNFTITVEDDNGGSTTVAANIASFTPVNDAPVFDATDTVFTVSEGGTVAVRATNISATDEETDDQALTFTISNLVAGEFLVNGSPSNTFTLQQINQNLVRFRHDGSETAPSYTVTVSDGELTATREDVPTFNAANDAPTVVTNQFDITEGEALLVDTTVLDAIDVETTVDNLIDFTITGLATGDAFLVSGTPQTTFTRADILAGNVTFLGNGDEVPPNFTITVTDDNGGSTPVTANIASFTPVNDAPTFDASDIVFAVSEGGSVSVRATNISATDEETDDQALTFTISNLIAGEFLVNGSPSDTFTLQQINQNLVRFRHDGSETPPSYTVTVSDGELSATRDDIPTFTDANDAPEVLNNSFSLQEGESITLTPANLNATDVETLDNNLVFAISDLAGGSFLFNGAPFDPTSQTFTLEDVILGNVVFQHDGSENGPAYTVTVTDDGAPSQSTSDVAAIEFTRLNDAPSILVNSFTIAEGGTLVITTTMIDAEDETGETPQSELAFTVSDVVGGFFALGTDSTQPISTFTREDINLRRVVFVQDGTNTTPSYTLTVEDTEGGTATSQSTVTFQGANDPPVIVTNTLAITEGETVTLTSSNLSATDEESIPADLTYTLTAVANGAFQLNGTPVGISGTFTQQDVLNGLVTFVHDNSSTPPSYSLTLTDIPVNGLPANTTTPSSGDVAFTAVNDEPFIVALAFTIQEGETVPLTTGQLNATDEETTNPALLVYTVDSVSNASFQLNGVDTDSFTQQDLIDNTVTFVHDGSESAPSYTVSVSDSGTPTPQEAQLTVDLPFTNVNDAPELLVNTLTIAEGETVTFNTDNLSATDLETADPDLLFDVTGITNGSFIVSGATFNTTAQFTLSDIIEGRVSFQHDDASNAPTYDVTVSDNNTPTPGITGPQTVTVEFTSDNDAPTILANNFTIDEGATLVLGAGNINAEDEVGETPRAELQYTVSNVTGGRFANSSTTSTPITSFSQDDIDQGRVVFVHDGSSITPSYTLTVEDADGGTATSQPTVTLVDVNDGPAIITNTLTLAEGETVTLTTANLAATDEESTPADLTYTVTSVANGEFQLNANPVNINGTFTQQDVLDGLVTFVHDGTSSTPTYTLTLTDIAIGGSPAVTTAPSDGDVIFTEGNDEPVVTAVPFTIQEGETFTLTTTQLSATDEETTDPALLIYTVTSVSNGSFQLSGTDTDSFTQQDILNSNVTFVQDGSESAPSYTLTVSDSGTPTPQEVEVTIDLDFTNLNDTPELLANALTINEGETVTFNTDNLSATDLETIDPDLVFDIAGITGGQFIVNGNPFNTTAQFTLADVIQGNVSFEHDGSETSPTYDVTVTDSGTGTGAPITTTPVAATIEFFDENDAPTIVANSFTINEGEILILNASFIDAIDEASETPRLDLQYTVANVAGGRFARSTATSTEITAFSQDDIDQGRIVFVHDGSNTTPSYTLTVTDQDGGTTTSEGSTTLGSTNDAPSITVNQLTLTEAETVTLSTNNLQAVDEESTAAELSYTVTAATGGDFQLNGNPTTTFTQQDVNNGLVTFVHNGLNEAPTYTLTVTDTAVGTPAITSAPNDGTITFTAVNDAPELTINFPTVGEGTTVPVTTAAINATDEESDATQLVYTVEATNGEFRRNGTATTSFTQAEIDANLIDFVHDGSDSAPSFTITLTDNGTPEPVTLPPQTVTPAFNELNNPPQFTANQLSPVEGATTTLTTANLAANDDDDAPGQLLFNIVSVTGGTFFLNGVALTSTDTFRRADVAFGSVTFVDDGDETPPTYTVAVTDTDGETVQQDAVITEFITTNDLPTITANAFDITEGAILTLNSSNLQVQDTETTDPALLTYTVSEAVAGGFFDDGANPITTFTQQNIDDGQVVFQHDGSTTAPSFGLTITDADGGSLSVSGAIDQFTPVNDAPIAVADGGLGFSTNESTPLVTPSLIANDTDEEGDSLTITAINGTAINPGDTATLASGALVTLSNDGSNSVTYNPNGAFDALIQNQPATDTFTYTVSDGTLTNTADVTIDVVGITEPAPVLFDYTEFLRSGNPNAAIPSIEVGGLPLAELYDENFYLNQNPDVANAVSAGAFASGFEHFVGIGINEGRAPSVLYNEAFYLDSHPDVAQAVDDGILNSGLEHFLNFGHFEGRDPSTLFNQADYLTNNPDVAQAVNDDLINSGFEHYIEFGAEEERLPSRSLYNEEFYLTNNPDVQTAVVAGIVADGFEHFISFGQTEGRPPSDLYNEASYLNLNPDVANAVAAGTFRSGFEHYEEFGRFEDRPVFS